MAYIPPGKLLFKGAEILEQKLDPLGFSFYIKEGGKGSGGEYVVGTFENGDREINLWFRYELGSVSYRKLDLEKAHIELMQYLGLEKEAKYPGFSLNDPLQGFRHLLEDWEHCSIYFDKNGDAFYQNLSAYEYQKQPTGLAALKRYEK